MEKRIDPLEEDVHAQQQHEWGVHLDGAMLGYVPSYEPSLAKKNKKQGKIKVSPEVRPSRLGRSSF